MGFINLANEHLHYMVYIIAIQWKGEKWRSQRCACEIVEKSALGKNLIVQGVNNKMKVKSILNVISSVRQIADDFPVNLIVVIGREDTKYNFSLSTFDTEYA